MALITQQLFVRTKRSIAGVPLDAVLVESHETRLNITKNPVEGAADITDHAIIEPQKLYIRAIVSDTPLGTAAFTELASKVSNFFGATGDDNSARSVSAYQAMVALQATRVPVEVQTRLKLYQNMLITSLTTVQDKDTSRVVELTIDMEEVRIVNTELVKVPASALAAGKDRQQAASPVNSGRRQPAPVAEPDREISILKNGIYTTQRLFQ